MSWDYADLSKSAKKAGGPGKLIKSIQDSSFSEGEKKGTLIGLAIGGGIALAASWCIKKVRSWFGPKRKEAKIEAEAAKEQLIQGINEYDAEHPESMKAVNEDVIDTENESKSEEPVDE